MCKQDLGVDCITTGCIRGISGQVEPTLPRAVGDDGLEGGLLGLIERVFGVAAEQGPQGYTETKTWNTCTSPVMQSYFEQWCKLPSCTTFYSRIKDVSCFMKKNKKRGIRLHNW